ncbi:hypothetical protein ACFVHQ_10615 [Actinomycetes bacterium NPDC127524]
MGIIPFDDNDAGKREESSDFLTAEEIESIKKWVDILRQYQFFPISTIVEAARLKMELKYPFLGHGFNRMVFDLENGYVLKIAFSDLGLRSIQQEYELYRDCPKDVKHLLCEVKEQGHGWIIMKKMMIKPSADIKTSYKIFDLYMEFLKHGIIPGDLRLGNVAISESSEEDLVVLDYGLFFMPFKKPFFL